VVVVVVRVAFAVVVVVPVVVDGMKWLVSQTRSSEWTPQLTNAL